MKKNITKDQIIATALDLIEAKQGRTTLTIREIAKVLGCSHPNIYNYYTSLDILLWDVIESVLQTMMEFVLNQIQPEQNSDQKFQTFIRSIVIFSLNNTEWYKLLWFDEIKTEIPLKTQEIVKIPGQKFAEFVLSIYPEIGDINTTASFTRLIHSYMHGEICKYITSRNFTNDRAELTDSITRNSVLLLKMLKNEATKISMEN